MLLDGTIWEVFVADLKNAYIDTRGITHRVIHLVSSQANEKSNRELVAVKVVEALTRPLK